MKKETGMRLALSFVFFLFFACIALFVTSPRMPPTGDEPGYLVTTHSLVVDRDISLLNNYRERHYRIFYPGLLAKRTTASGDRQRELPTFGMGLSVFFVPFYNIALKEFPEELVPFLRIVVCLVAGLLVYLLLDLGTHLTGSVRAPLVICAAALPASPMIFYSNLFYPEIFGSVLLLLALKQFQTIEKRTFRSLIALSLIVSLLVWLHPKYLALCFLVFVLTLYHIYLLRKKERAGLSIPVLLFAVIAAAGVFTFFLFLYTKYGSWSPNRIYGGWQKQTSLIELIRELGFERIWIMFRMVFAYWLDQRFGLVPYAPMYIAFFPAFAWMGRNKRDPVTISLVVLFIAHFLLLCWGAQLGGYAPPSRQVVVLVPFVCLVLMLVYPKWGRFQKIIFSILTIFGWTIAFLMLSDYRLIFTNTTWRNREGNSPFWQKFSLDHVIPNFTVTDLDFVVILLWIVLVVLAAFAFYPKSKATEQAQSP